MYTLKQIKRKINNIDNKSISMKDRGVGVIGIQIYNGLRKSKEKLESGPSYGKCVEMASKKIGVYARKSKLNNSDIVFNNKTKVEVQISVKIIKGTTRNELCDLIKKTIDCVHNIEKSYNTEPSKLFINSISKDYTNKGGYLLIAFNPDSLWINSHPVFCYYLLILRITTLASFKQGSSQIINDKSRALGLKLFIKSLKTYGLNNIFSKDSLNNWGLNKNCKYTNDEESNTKKAVFQFNQGPVYINSQLQEVDGKIICIDDKLMKRFPESKFNKDNK